jgi:hypothetical protein
MIRDFSTYYIIANSDIGHIDVAKLQSLAAIGGKADVRYTTHLPPPFAAQFATKVCRNTSSTADPIPTESPPQRLEVIMVLSLDVQQRLKVIEKYLYFHLPTVPPAKHLTQKLDSLCNVQFSLFASLIPDAPSSL